MTGHDPENAGAPEKLCDAVTGELPRDSTRSESASESERWRGRGVYVPEGLTRADIIIVADALMAIEEGQICAPPFDRSEAMFLANAVLRALRARHRLAAT
jgi:hypothetical protein